MNYIKLKKIMQYTLKQVNKPIPKYYMNYHKEWLKTEFVKNKINKYNNCKKTYKKNKIYKIKLLKTKNN